MDLMSRVFCVSKLELYPYGKKRMLVYIASKLVVVMEVDFQNDRRIYIAGDHQELRFAYNPSNHRYQQVNDFNEFDGKLVYSDYRQARNQALEIIKKLQEQGYDVAFPDGKDIEKGKMIPPWYIPGKKPMTTKERKFEDDEKE